MRVRWPISYSAHCRATKWSCTSSAPRPPMWLSLRNSLWRSARTHASGTEATSTSALKSPSACPQRSEPWAAAAMERFLQIVTMCLWTTPPSPLPRCIRCSCTGKKCASSAVLPICCAFAAATITAGGRCHCSQHCCACRANSNTSPFHPNAMDCWLLLCLPWNEFAPFMSLCGLVCVWARRFARECVCVCRGVRAPGLLGSYRFISLTSMSVGQSVCWSLCWSNCADRDGRQFCSP